MPQNRMRRGGILVTPYGVATFMSYREKDNVYRLKLPYAEIYVKGERINPDEEFHGNDDELKCDDKKAMEINEAYAALERMRQVNLGLICQELGMHDVDHEDCTVCVMERAKKAKQTGSPSRKSWIKKSKPDRCLTCGSPSCPSHSSEIFKAENITLCKECEKVFQIEFIMSAMTLDSKERRDRIDHLIDLYDRTVLLLNYSMQYIVDVAKALEETKKRQSKLNVGGSSAGIVSGVLGMAAAFSILTPAGPPLLIAALLFGGGATAVQTGTELKQQYFFEPGKVADRILALYGMLLTILTVTGTLRDAALLDQNVARFVSSDSPAVEELKKVYVENREELLTEAMESQTSSSIRVDRAMLAAAVAAEASHNRLKKRGKIDAKAKSNISIVSRSSRYMSRLGAGIMRTAQFAQLAGGALAAASLLIEARGMSNAIRSIKAGSCAKAQMLRRIEASLPRFPSTLNIEKECVAYLNYMIERAGMSQEDAAQLLMEVSTKCDHPVDAEVQAKSEIDDSSESSSRSASEEHEDENEQPLFDDRIPVMKQNGKYSLRSTSLTASVSSSSETLAEDEALECMDPLALSEAVNVCKKSFVVQ
ncbi:hypothetical protein ACA910_007875 [Epithemia clementina (nom. ined.)]